MSILSQAFSGGTAGEASTKPQEPAAPGKKIRSRVPDWHRKAGRRGGVLWDLDNDLIAEKALLGSMAVDYGDGQLKKPGLLKPGNPLYEAAKRR